MFLWSYAGGKCTGGDDEGRIGIESVKATLPIKVPGHYVISHIWVFGQRARDAYLGTSGHY